MKAALALLFLIALYVDFTVAADTRPDQVRLSVTGDPSRMLVTWFTANETSLPPIVRYGYSPDALNFTSNTSLQIEQFTEAGWYGFTYSIVLENLTPATKYYYQCGNDPQLSDIFYFTTESTAPDATMKIAWFGDMGSTDANDTIDMLTEAAQAGQYNMVMHVGDIAYCDFSHGFNGDPIIWNAFLSDIQPIAAYTPYMVAPGNHDRIYHWRVYHRTFRMIPVETTIEHRKPWFEFSYQNAHFISFSTEHDYLIISEQYWWLVDRLKNYQENLKDKYPWLILFAHRPLRCSNAWNWCSDGIEALPLRMSIGPLLDKHKVDIFVSGHTHSYERTHPIDEHANVQPGRTVHLIVGSAGDREGFDLKWKPQPDWSVTRNSFQGFGEMTVHNATHIHWEFIRTETKAVYDECWLVKV